MSDDFQFTMPKPWKEVLEFWFGDGLEEGWPSEPRGRLWFRGGPALDAEINERFGHLVEAALWSELVEWEGTPEPRLALVMLLDQFTRHIFRGTERAFAGDHRAQTLVVEALARGMDRELPWVGRVFFCMPLMHAEDPDLQDRAVAELERLRDEAPEPVAKEIQGNVKFAREHRDIIARFGRFPHRNRVLGRESTPEEEAFLEKASSYGQ